MTRQALRILILSMLLIVLGQILITIAVLIA